jgi:hypothetical protein
MFSRIELILAFAPQAPHAKITNWAVFSAAKATEHIMIQKKMLILKILPVTDLFTISPL